MIVRHFILQNHIAVVFIVREANRIWYLLIYGRILARLLERSMNFKILCARNDDEQERMFKAILTDGDEDSRTQQQQKPLERKCELT